MRNYVVLIALGAAFLLALRDTFGRLAMRGIDPVAGSGASAVLGLPILILVSLLSGDFTLATPVRGWPLVAIGAAGILRITGARTLLFAGIKRIGSARASSLMSSNTFFAVLLGFLLLNERVTPSLGGGAVLVVAGCFLIGWSRHGAVSPGAGKDYAAGMGLALLSGLSIGTAMVVAKTAIGAFASPNYANLHANAIAILISLPFLMRRDVRAGMKRWPLKTWGLLALTGSVASLGVTLVYLALTQAPVALVSPIAQSRPLFVIAISWMFFQRDEKVTRHVVMGAAVIVAGTALLILGR